MLTLDKVIATLPQQVRDAYAFHQAVYTRATAPILNIQCPAHGVFQQYSGNLRQGIGCPTCGTERGVQSRRLPPEEYYSRVMAKHRGEYTYPAQDYVNMSTKIHVECPTHGTFTISPLKHLYEGQGCPVCGAAKRGHRVTKVNVGAMAAATSIKKHAALFMEVATKVHKGRYDYSNTVYMGRKKAVTIICPTHGEFSQRPEKHIYEAQGCPRCGQKSSGEAAVAALLAQFTPIIQRDRSLLAPKELDIFMPEKKLAVEYCGDFWHSHGDVEDEAKNAMNHFNKHNACEALGIRLVTMYESEWEQHNHALRRLLRNAVGKSRGKLMARKCELKKVEHRDAVMFYDRYHPQGGAGTGAHYGLYWNGKLVACMRFAKGANDRGNNTCRQWTLTRYATRVTVAGGASRLFRAFMEEHKPKEVKSFSDNRYFGGAMYEALGFVQQGGTAAPDYSVYHPKLGTLPKSAWQRRNLPSIAAKLGVELEFDPETDPRTERGITYLLGGRRLYDCGKKRWVFVAPKRLT